MCAIGFVGTGAYFVADFGRSNANPGSEDSLICFRWARPVLSLHQNNSTTFHRQLAPVEPVAHPDCFHNGKTSPHYTIYNAVELTGWHR